MRSKDEVIVVSVGCGAHRRAGNGAKQPDTGDARPPRQRQPWHMKKSTTPFPQPPWKGALTVSADATVRYPASLELPVARVLAMGFTQEQTSAYFDYFLAGEQPIVVVNNGAANETKQSLRDLIALYEQEIADEPF